MSEGVIEKVEDVLVKKKWKVKILLFPMIFFGIAIWTDFSFGDALIISIWGFPFYWVWEKAKKSSNESSWKPATEHESMFDDRSDYGTDWSRYDSSSKVTEPFYHGVAGYDIQGNVSSSGTAIGGISN